MVALLAAFVLGILIWITLPALAKLFVWFLKALLIVAMCGAVLALGIALMYLPKAHAPRAAATATEMVR